MDGQGAGGFGFVVREVISGPRELAEVAPAQAVTLACLAGSDGEGQFWCGQLEQPVKHRIGQTVDTGRYHADYLDRDEFGPFVWTYYIALQTHDAVTFSADAHSVVVDLAYVIDPSLGYDTTFDSNKVDWVATATVDGANAEVSAEPEVIPEPEPQPESASSAPLRRAEPVLPAPIEQLAEEGPSVSREQFGHALDGALATLGTLTGSFPLDMPRPREVKARKHSPDRFRGECPSYSFQANEVRYHTVDPRRGPVWQSTADPREALYWMVDDVARSVAWTWARRTPAARTMNDDDVQWLLAAPMWLTLMTALDASWAGKTRTRISALKKHDQETRRRPQILGSPCDVAVDGDHIRRQPQGHVQARLTVAAGGRDVDHRDPAPVRSAHPRALGAGHPRFQTQPEATDPERELVLANTAGRQHPRGVDPDRTTD